MRRGQHTFRPGNKEDRRTCYHCRFACLHIANFKNILLRQAYFYPCDAMLTQYLLSSRVCLSVRLLQISVLQKCLSIESQKQRRTISQGLWFYCAKDHYKISMGSFPGGDPNVGGIGKNCVFSTDSEVASLDALPPKICVRPPWWSASMTVALVEKSTVSSTTLVVVKL